MKGREETREAPEEGMIAIDRALPEDLALVLTLYEEAAAWLAERGIDQWRTGTLPRERAAAEIARGEVWLARRDGEPLGMLKLQSADRLIWGETPDDAWYLHGLTVRREYAGRGFGRALLDWAAARARASGRCYLRLDCMWDNPALRAYYEAAGFTPRGEKTGPGWSVALYEKRL